MFFSPKIELFPTLIIYSFYPKPSSRSIVASLIQDAANAFIPVFLCQRNPSETHFTPVGAPRVFENQVILTIGRVDIAIADSQHSMTDVGAARLPVYDTAVVEFHEGGAGVDGDGDGPQHQCRFQLLHRFRTRAVVVVDLDDSMHIPNILALLLGFPIGILTLLDNVAVLRILEGLRKQAAIAAEVVPGELAGAIYKLLHGQIHQDPKFLLYECLQSRGDHESPAGAALALGLREGDGALLAPVDILVSGYGGVGENLEVGATAGKRISLHLHRLFLDPSHALSPLRRHPLILLVRPVRHKIERKQGLGVRQGVVGVDEGEGGGEYLQSPQVLVLRGILLLVDVYEIGEFGQVKQLFR